MRGETRGSLVEAWDIPRESILVVGTVVGHDECGIRVFAFRFQLRRIGKFMKK
jgi:hypothetical protein